MACKEQFTLIGPVEKLLKKTFAVPSFVDRLVLYTIYIILTTNSN